MSVLERLLKVARSKVPVGLAINTESGEGEKKVFGRLSIALNYQRPDSCHRGRDLICRPNFRKFKENFEICLHSLVEINSLKGLPFSAVIMNPHYSQMSADRLFLITVDPLTIVA